MSDGWRYDLDTAMHRGQVILAISNPRATPTTDTAVARYTAGQWLQSPAEKYTLSDRGWTPYAWTPCPEPPANPEGR